MRPKRYNHRKLKLSKQAKLREQSNKIFKLERKLKSFEREKSNIKISIEILNALIKSAEIAKLENTSPEKFNNKNKVSLKKVSKMISFINFFSRSLDAITWFAEKVF